MKPAAGGWPKIYTVGYSSFTFESFVQALKRHSVTAVVDVRSSPYSKFKPEFNRETLKLKLGKQAVEYVFMGELLGARPADRSVYTDGFVDFEKVARSSFFKQGVSRLLKGSEGHQLALMCAEKDPLACHRTALISRNIKELFEILHIRHDASLEPHRELEKRLQKKYGYDQAPLFGDSLQLAYREHGKIMSHPFKDDNAEEEGIF